MSYLPEPTINLYAGGPPGPKPSVILLATLIGLAAATVATYIFTTGHTWILYIALVVLVVAGVVACLMHTTTGIECDPSVAGGAGIECDPSAAGGARNIELLCEELGNDTYRCYMPGADCQRAFVEVEAVDEGAIDWMFDDMYVKTKNKTYYVNAVLPRDANDTTFVGQRDMPDARPAYDVLPYPTYPLIRAAVGSILGGG